MRLEETYCQVDDFCKDFISQWQKKLISGKERQRQRSGHLSVSELVTILILFHLLTMTEQMQTYFIFEL